MHVQQKQIFDSLVKKSSQKGEGVRRITLLTASFDPAAAAAGDVMLQLNVTIEFSALLGGSTETQSCYDGHACETGPQSNTPLKGFDPLCWLCLQKHQIAARIHRVLSKLHEKGAAVSRHHHVNIRYRLAGFPAARTGASAQK